LFTNAGGEVAAAGAPQGHSSGADAKSEQPVCEEAVGFTLGGLQELELLALFAEHLHVQIAVGFDPVLVDFDGERRMSRRALSSLGKIRMTWVRRLIS
jgi:hypothetical protein